MNFKRNFLSLVIVFLASLPAYGQPEEESEALKTVLGKWESAWNSGSLDKIIKLFHPDNKMRKAAESSDQAKASIEKEFAKMINAFGTFEKYELGTYIDRKKCRVVKITYSEKGLVPGTWRLKKEGDQWLIDDFNVDGQGEPELTE